MAKGKGENNVKFVTQRRLRMVGVILVVSFLVFWWGVPTFNKWRADRLVDELCAKDGGINVYETVELPPEKFDPRGNFRLSSKRFMKEDDEYYYETQIFDIVSNSGSFDIASLTVYKTTHKVFRKKDRRLLGESTHYSRRGGDPVGPWHPSSYTCREKNDLASRIFRKSN